MKTKSSLNKTIDFSLEEGQRYLEKCVKFDNTLTDILVEKILDKTVHADTFMLLPKIQKNSIDLIIADPPYNLTKNYHGKKFKATASREYEAYTRKWLSLVIPLLKPTGTLYVCCDWKSSLIIGKVLEEMLTVQNRITWQREKGRGTTTNWKNSMEDIWFATKNKDVYTFNIEAVKILKKVIAPYRDKNGKAKDWKNTDNGNERLTCPSNFWDDITIPFWSMAENTAHPTQKSEKLLAKLILASSNKNDIVLDPFAGSGSTAVTAKKLGRHYIGIEQNPLYCAWGEYRLEMAEKNPIIQGMENGVFRARNT
ncbi:MAG: site-specific DNA-methyltransferase [Treponema sp. CETP13]|nr:MAG: site-specific DNA-methyltransferase [Treponema sp. CETP13]